MTGRQLTVGVLGHVDHGKTALVKALTGTDTDRLEEEKRRGLSIVLGFAFLEINADIIDFIDAPGHENFIRTMISGATGIDAVLLVIAADEGIKPQTREHFAIARLLGIEHGLIVINKSDLVDVSSLATVKDEIGDAMRGTFLERAPVHVVSATSGKGIDDLKQALAGMVSDKAPVHSTDSFCLPMDRVFTVDGVGTVGTGTLRSGGIRCEDEVEVVPSGLKANIREIQVHNQKVAEAFPGQRVAVNLRGVKREQLERGQVLVRPGALQATKCLHAKLQVLDDLPRLPKRNELIRLLFGTTEVFAKMRIVGDRQLEPGESLLVRFRCRDVVFVSTGERFIARTSSPVITFAGGEFLDTSEDLLQLPEEKLVNHLCNLEQADVEGRIVAHVQVAGMRGIDKLALAERATASGSKVETVLEKSNAVNIDDTIAIDRSAFDNLCDKSIRLLKRFHQENPTATGQNLDIFRSKCIAWSRGEIIDYVLVHLDDTKQIKIVGNTVRLFAFNQDENIDPSDREAIDNIEQVFRDGGAVTPFLDEVVGDDPARTRAYQYLKDSGKLIALKDHNGKRFFVFHQETIETIRKQLAETYPPPSNFTVSDFRKLTGSTRKYVIPMLEYFDRNRITIRQGNNRSLSRIEN